MQDLNSKRINVGLIGFGHWGRNWARIIFNSVKFKLVALCDSSETNRNFAHQTYESVMLYNNYIDLLNLSMVEAVIVATPVVTHFEIVKEALLRDKHVLCEKVLSDDYNQVNFLLNLAADRNLVLDVDFTFLHNAVVWRLADSIKKNELGEVLYLTFKRANLGPVRKDVSVVEDLASHDISILIYLYGMPSWVMATAQKFNTSNTFGSCFINLGFNDGVVASIQSSWISPIKQRVIEVVGSEGMLIFDDVNPMEKLKIIKIKEDYTKHIDDFGTFKLNFSSGDIVIPEIEYTEPLKNKADYLANKVLEFRISACGYQDSTSRPCAKIIEAINVSIMKDGDKIYI